MTDVLRVGLVVIGVVLALLAAWVVAPDAPIREARSALAAVRRIFGREPVPQGHVLASFGSSWSVGTASGRADRWNPAASVDDRMQVLRDQIIELHELVNTTNERLRKDLGRRIDGVTDTVTALTSTVADHWSEYQAAEERSNNLDASGFIPAAFGVILGAASEPLAAMTWIGVPLVIVGVGMTVRCVMVLRTHFRQRRRITAATS